MGVIRLNAKVVAVLLLSSLSFAVDPVDAAVNRLANVEYYAFGGVGFAGVTSRGEKDYKAIFVSPNGLQEFELLFSRGNPAAKCYALFGIRKLDKEKFKKLAAPLRHSQIEVSTMRGCLESRERLGDLIARIEKEKF